MLAPTVTEEIDIMKRILAVLLTLTMILPLVACGGGSSLVPEENGTLIHATGEAPMETGEGKHDPTGPAVGSNAPGISIREGWACVEFVKE